MNGDMMRKCKLIALAVVATLSVSGAAHAQVEVSAGADYREGTYGTDQRVSTSTASVAVRAKRKRLTLIAEMPMVRTDAPANVVVSGGPFGLPIFVEPTRPSTRVRRTGPGDARIGAALQVFDPTPGHVALALNASAKLPTASAQKGLGTGKTDFSFGADLARAGKVTPFVGVAYTVVGQPSAYRLNNVLSARGGVGLRVGKSSELNLSYNYASHAVNGIEDRRELGSGFATMLSKRVSLGVDGTVGLSRGAPDAGAGVRLGVRL